VNGSITRFYAFGEQSQGIAHYLTRDHLGSVREITDSSGAVVARYDYEPYGAATRTAGEVDSRFGFTGHLAHLPSGLLLGKRPANAVLTAEAKPPESWSNGVVQATARRPMVAAQARGVSSWIRDCGCVATRSKTSLR
jgi:hypothetical protein